MKTQQESAKIREVLVIQDILRSLADDAVRQDFLDGTNGAVKIEQSDMDLLEKLYVEVTPKRPTRSDEPTFTQSATHSANTFSSVIDSRPKPFGESTYDHVKETLQSIQNCGYFEKEIIQVETKAADTEQDAENDANATDEEKSSEADINPDLVEAPGASAVPQPEGLILQMAVNQPAANILPSVPANAVPVMPVTTVRAVEQNYYKQYMQPQHPQQPPPAPQATLRPIHEVIGTGNFHFLQDSELDSSDMIMTTGPFPQQQQQQKLPATPMVPGIPTNAQQQQHPPATTPVLSNSVAPAGNVTQFPGSNFPQQQPAPQPPTMFNANVLSKDQPHIPPFTNVNPVIPVGTSHVPGFAMNPTPVNAMAQIAQLQSMIQQQQQLSGSIKVSQQQPPKQQDLNADDLTEKLKSTLHINDNNSSTPNNNSNNHAKTTSSPLTNHHTSEDWNDVNNDANSWSNQMAEESTRSNDRFKRNGNNIGGMFRSSDTKFGGGSSSYRPRNTYQNGNRGGGGGMQSNGESSSVFFRNNDRYYSQNGNKDTYKSGNGNLGTYKPSGGRPDMLNNRPPRMQSGAPGGDYRPRTAGGQGNGRDNRGGLKA